MSGQTLAAVLTPPSPFWADLASPLADRLTLLWSADGNYDVISGAFGILSGAAPPTAAIGDVGKYYLFNGGTASNSYIDLGVRIQHADIARGTPFTVFSVCAPLGSVNHTIACHSDNNATNAGWCVGLNTAGQISGLVERASSNATFGGGALTFSVRAGSPFQTVAACHDGQNATTSGSGSFNGVAIPSASATTGSGIQGSDSTRNTYIGGNNSGLINASFSGGIKLVAVWRRVLTPSEISALHADPMLLYRNSRRRRNRVAGIASGGAASARPVVFACT